MKAAGSSPDPPWTATLANAWRGVKRRLFSRSQPQHEVGAATGGTLHYWVFISYSHHDRKSAVRLQSALDGFRLPRAGAGQSGQPRKPGPVFRDREALGSGHDLRAAVWAALDRSQYLLVVCSPSAAASGWVAEEVRRFVERRGPEHVVCFIVDGVPNSADPAKECLPEPLRRAHSGYEVLAADARPEADGWRDAVLRALSGLTGIKFAQLARRDRVRFRRRAFIWAAAGLALALVFGVLAVHSERNAFAARKSAESAERIANYLEDILAQFRPRVEDNTARAALLPFIDASATPARLRQLQSDPLALIRVRNVLGMAYLELNSADRALPLLQDNARLAEDFLGRYDPRTSGAWAAVGNAYNALGDHRRGAEIFSRLLEEAIRLHGEKSEGALEAMTNLAISRWHSGRLDEAEKLRIRVYELGKELFPPDHLGFQNARRNHAMNLWRQGKLGEAIEIGEELRRDQDKSPGPESLAALETAGFLAEVYEQKGDLDRAAELYARAADGLARIHGPDDSRATFCAFRLAHLLSALGRKEEARKVSARYFGRSAEERKAGDIGHTPSGLPE